MYNIALHVMGESRAHSYRRRSRGICFLYFSTVQYTWCKRSGLLWSTETITCLL